MMRPYIGRRLREPGTWSCFGHSLFAATFTPEAPFWCRVAMLVLAVGAYLVSAALPDPASAPGPKP